MGGYAATAKASAAAAVTGPTGFPDGWTYPAPYPPGWQPTQGGTTWSRTYAYSSTSGASSAAWFCPEGEFSLNTSEFDSASVKTQIIGGLTFTYSGKVGYGGRGTVTVTGTGSYASVGQINGGEYQYIESFASGAAVVTGTVLVATGGVRYTSSGEGYTNTLLAATTSITPLTVVHSPVVFRSP